MARRSRKKANKGGLPLLLILGGGVLLLVVAVLVAMGIKPGGSSANDPQGANFSIPEYRLDASRFTGNSYRIEGRVEHIETMGNDRIVAISVKGNKQERLPLLVRSGVSGRVNLTRGDQFVFDVVCRTGRDASGAEVKGVLVVERVETK